MQRDAGPASRPQRVRTGYDEGSAMAPRRHPRRPRDEAVDEPGSSTVRLARLAEPRPPGGAGARPCRVVPGSQHSMTERDRNGPRAWFQRLPVTVSHAIAIWRAGPASKRSFELSVLTATHHRASGRREAGAGQRGSAPRSRVPSESERRGRSGDVPQHLAAIQPVMAPMMRMAPKTANPMAAP